MLFPNDKCVLVHKIKITHTSRTQTPNLFLVHRNSQSMPMNTNDRPVCVKLVSPAMQKQK